MSGVTIALAMLALGLIASRILLRSYAELEDRETREHIERALNLLGSQLRSLDELDSAYAVWDDTYAFVEDGNPAYVASNFTDSTFTQSRLNLLAVLNSSERVIYQRAFDVENAREVPISADWWPLIAPGSPLLHGPDSAQSVRGIVSLAESPMLVVSRPILTSDDTGPARGSFIMGRYLNEAELHGLAEITGDKIAIRRLVATDLEADFRAAREQLSWDASRLVRILNQEEVAGYALLLDINGRPGFIVRVLLPRDIYLQGQVSTRYLVFALLLAMFAAGVAGLAVLERSVLRRVARLNLEVGAIGRSGDSAGRVTVSGQDELSALAHTINGMVAALAERTAENTRLYQSVQTELAERQRAEAALAAERNMLRTVIDNIPNAHVFLKDAQSRFLMTSRSHLAIMGRTSEDEVLGKTDFDLFPHDLAAQYYADEQAVVRSGQPLIAREETAVDSLGRERWLLTTKMPLKDNSGQVTTLVGISVDITERKRVEEALKESDAQFRTLFEASPDAIVLLDPHGCWPILDCNTAACQMNGYTRDELVGQSIDVLNLTPGVPAERAEYLERIRQSDVLHLETSHRRKDGTVFPVEVSTSLIALGGRDVVLGIDRDITERKRAEQALSAANADLEQAVQRAQELAVVADAANRAKSEFLANMSHEIRTPMNAIVGMTSLMLDTEMNADQREFVETIRASVDTLLTIINDILDFSKIESGRLELESVAFDLRGCIEETLDLFAVKAAEKGIELAYAMSEDMPRAIVSDPTRLRQVLANLVGNAVKFTEHGEVVVEVKDEGGEQKDEGGLILHPSSFILHFSVRDTGIGIPPERTDRLFKSFSQVDASTTRQYGGSGLGLAISKRLVEMLGGRVWVESVPGQGSTFHFTVVAAEAVGAPAPVLIDLGVLTGKRILVVDDNATNRAILLRQTQAWGMLPELADSGPAALEAAGRGAAFDVAVLDMHMPEMDGLELGAKLQHGYPELPLIMLSSWGWRGGQDQGVTFAAYLTKPVKPAQLGATLARVLSRVDQAAPLVIIPAAPQGEQFDTHAAERNPLRILVAEDNMVNQKVTVRMLERMGYRVDVAANGHEVLAALRRQPYDVVLMDVQMPEMDGLEATQIVRREWPIEYQPRILAMTASARSEDRDACLAAGMDDFLGKPVRPAELAQALERCHRSREAAAAVLPASSSPASGVGELETFVANLTGVREMLGADGLSALPELVHMYLRNGDELLDEMRHALATDDAPTLHRAAHTLKGGSGIYGATNLADICRKLEDVARDGVLAGAAESIAEISAEFEQVRAVLEREVGT